MLVDCLPERGFETLRVAVFRLRKISLQSMLMRSKVRSPRIHSPWMTRCFPDARCPQVRHLLAALLLRSTPHWASETFAWPWPRTRGKLPIERRKQRARGHGITLQLLVSQFLLNQLSCLQYFSVSPSFGVTTYTCLSLNLVIFHLLLTDNNIWGLRCQGHFHCTRFKLQIKTWKLWYEPRSNPYKDQMQFCKSSSAFYSYPSEVRE